MPDRLAEKRQAADAAGRRLGDHAAVTFAAAAIGDDGLSEPFPALIAGDHIYGGREIKITEADLDMAVENFERFWKPVGGVPVDYDHSFVESGDSTAAGWIVHMERRGDTLYEQVKWTPRAAQQIADGEFRFYSAEFTDSWINERGHDEGFTVLAGALTNRPFLRDLAPVALSQKVVEGIGEWALNHADQLPREEASGRDETPAEVADKTDKPTTFTVTIDGKEQTFTAEQVAEVFTKNAALEQKVTEAEKTAETEKGKVEALTTKVDTLATDLATTKFSTAFKRRQEEGAVDAKPETREKWDKRVEKFGVEDAIEMLDELPADTIPVTERGSDGGAPRTRVEGDVPEDTDPEMFTLDARAQQILAEKPDLEGGYRAALTQARGEMKAEGAAA